MLLVYQLPTILWMKLNEQWGCRCHTFHPTPSTTFFAPSTSLETETCRYFALAISQVTWSGVYLDHIVRTHVRRDATSRRGVRCMRIVRVRSRYLDLARMQYSACSALHVRFQCVTLVHPKGNLSAPLQWRLIPMFWEMRYRETRLKDDASSTEWVTLVLLYRYFDGVRITYLPWLIFPSY